MFTRWMSKEIGEFIQWDITLQNTNTQNNLDESQKYYVLNKALYRSVQNVWSYLHEILEQATLTT